MAPTTHSVDFESFANIIDGHQRLSAQNHQCKDPSNLQVLWDIPLASDKDIEEATQAAKSAFKTWSKVSFAQRQSRIKEFRDVLATYSADLTKCLIKESGKPASIATMEVHASLDMIDWYTKLQEPVLPNFEDDEKEIQNIYEPLGTVAAITPWNFPLLLPIAKTIPGLLMGNAVILKPSPFSP